MDIGNIITIAAALIAVFSSVSWGILYAKGKSLWQNLKELKDEYTDAVADGTITDDEKTAIIEEMVEVIDDAASIWQSLRNIFVAVIGIFRKK